MKAARSTSSLVTIRRAGLVACTGGAAAAVLYARGVSVHAREGASHSEADEVPAVDAEERRENEAVEEEKQWEEVWEEEKPSFLRPYITSVRIAAQETIADVHDQWDTFKAKNDLDHKWDVVSQQVSRYYWLITGHRVGPQIAVAATAGVLASVVTRKVLRVPVRLALLSGGLATASLLPPYDQTVPYLKHRYETFEWAEVEQAVREKPAAYYKSVTDNIKSSLPFGLGKTTKEEDKLETKEIDEVRVHEKSAHTHDHAHHDHAGASHNHHDAHAHHHVKATEEEACCHDEGQAAHKHDHAQHADASHNHHDAHHHHHHEKKEEATVH